MRFHQQFACTVCLAITLCLSFPCKHLDSVTLLIGAVFSSHQKSKTYESLKITILLKKKKNTCFAKDVVKVHNHKS